MIKFNLNKRIVFSLIIPSFNDLNYYYLLSIIFNIISCQLFLFYIQLFTT